MNEKGQTKAGLLLLMMFQNCVCAERVAIRYHES